MCFISFRVFSSLIGCWNTNMAIHGVMSIIQSNISGWCSVFLIVYRTKTFTITVNPIFCLNVSDQILWLFLWRAIDNKDRTFWPATRAVARTLMGGGGVYSYIHLLHDEFLFKSNSSWSIWNWFENKIILQNMNIRIYPPHLLTTNHGPVSNALL